MALLSAAGAGGAPVNSYTATSTPLIVQPSSARMYTIRLTNDSASPERAQRARIGIPAGFSVSSMTAATSAAGTCAASTWQSLQIVNGIAEFKKAGGGGINELCPGGTLTISITASAPTEGVWTWTTELLRDTGFALQGSQPGVRVDGTPPVISIDASPADPSNTSSSSFAFSANEPGVAFECKLDGGAFAACTSPTAFGPLPDGNHVFELRGTDGAGNVSAKATRSWTIATVAPLTTIDSAPPAYSNSASASFSFSTPVSGSTFECKLDDGGFEPCASPKSYGSLAEGAHNFQVRATDSASNPGSPIGHSWVVDTTAPAASIQTHPVPRGKSTSATFEFTADESGATFRCRLDEGAFAACVSPKAYTSLTDRVHTFAVEATDRAGNAGSPAMYTWTVDTVAPNTSITANPPSVSASASASLSFTSSEAGSTFECMLNAQPWVACSSPQSYAGLPDGRHTFSVRATDGAGNVDETPSSLAWTIDTAAPDTTILIKPPILVNSSTGSFAFSATEVGATFECKLDAEASFTACGASKTYASLADGQHTLTVLARDSAGNADPTPASHTWTIDTAAPDTTINDAPTDPSSSGVATFTFSSSEPGSSFECKIDSSSFTACSSPGSYSLLDGTHTFQVRARDAAGNTDAVAATRTWRIDTAEPDTIITSAPGAWVASRTATIAFSSPDPGVEFDCRRDAEPYASCTSPKSYSNLAEGPHTFDVRARDGAGNKDLSPAAATWNVDVTAPDTSIVSRPPELTRTREATFEFSSNENGVTFQCRRDDAATFSACASPQTYSNLDNGVHTFVVRAVDRAGNIDSDAASYTWTIDGTPPPTTITSGAKPLTNEPNATFNFTSTDQNATFECQLDGAPYAPCASPATYEALPDGDHTFNVRALDRAGNVGPAETRTWRIDTVAPAVKISLPFDGSATNDTTPGFAGTAGSAVSDSATVMVRIYAGAVVTNTETQAFPVLRVGANWSGATGVLAQGVYTARADQTDLAGNTGYSPPVRFTVDTGGPGTAIIVGPPNPSPSGTATFQFSSSDPLATFSCRLDAGEFVACASPITYDGLAAGTHVFAVHATDRAGNTGGNATYSWTILVPPSPPAPPAPPALPTVAPAAPDLIAPHEVARVRVKAADATVTLVWALPRDPDFDRVSVTRTAPGKGVRATTIYQGTKRSLTDRRLKNGVRYRYRLTTHDRAGNRSPGIVVAATPLAPLASPLNGANVTAPPLLRWQAVPRATYYNVQLWLVRGFGSAKAARPGKVLSAWPAKTRLQVSPRWRFEGTVHRLVPGQYRWYVFPGFGKRSAVRYGGLLGQSMFTVGAKRATAR